MSFEIRIETNATVADILRVQRTMREAIAQAVRVECERIMKVSKRDHVPVDDGHLKGSGSVSDAVWEGDELTCQLSYGGPAASYALAVHEHPDPEVTPESWWGKGALSMTKRLPPHPDFVTFHPRGHGPKYLEIPMIAATEGMTERLSASLAKALS